MPKKSRKMKERAAQRRVIVQTRTEKDEPSVESRATLVTPSARTASTPISRQAPRINFDYSHIYADLRRIALFAGFFFAVLIILSYVIK